jgi:hypothetical protein
MAVRKTLDSEASKSAGTSAKGSIDQIGAGFPAAGKGAIDGEEHVDQIRDILFGAQRQDYERRFARLEELLVKNISDLSNVTTRESASYQEEYDRRLTKLEELLVKKVSELSLDIERKIDILKGENDKSFRELEEQFKKAISGVKEDTGKQLNLQKSEFSHKLSSLEGDLVKTISDLKKQSDSDAASLKQDIGNAKSENIRSLERLDMNKVDHSTLAKFLHHLAANLEHKDTKTDPIK